MKVSEQIDTAADLIERYGWGTIVWGLGDGDGPLCIEGGLAVAGGIVSQDEAGSCPAALAVCDYLGITLGERSRLYNWNDQTGVFSAARSGEPVRTQEEVVEVLRAAAMVEFAKESARDPEANVCTTSQDHVRIVAAHNKLPVIEAGGYLYAVRKVPLLGQPIIYRATVTA